MLTSGLSLDNIPPLRTPLSFFLTAPLFGILAALMLVIDPGALQSRWQPGLLAFTHLLTLGFGAQIMVGALFQVLPVVSNQAIPGGPHIAPWIRWGLILGTLCLAAGFLTGQPSLFMVATVLLGSSFALFALALGLGIRRARPVGDTTRGLALALFALAVTLTLGGLQVSVHFWPEAGLYRLPHTDLHATWGGMGWSLLLIMAVSFQVIPMFHVAPAFPSWLTRWLPGALLATLLLLLLTESGSIESSSIGLLASALICLCGLAYGAVALHILDSRKRKLVDYTVRFWQLGLGHLLLACALGLVSLTPFAPGWLSPRLLGLLLGLGFVGSVMLGMLQKIIPFLIYLHLQRACLSNPLAITSLPNMKTLIPTLRSRRQWQLHLAALGTLYGALIWPPLSFLAGLALLADFAWLGWSLRQAYRLYLTTLTRLETAAEPACTRQIRN